MPDASIRALCADAMFPAVITIRDPCDAIASLVLRFGQDFEGALNAVGRVPNMLTLQHQSEPIVLRYESGFTTSDFEIAKIAVYLGIVVGKGRLISCCGIHPQRCHEGSPICCRKASYPGEIHHWSGTRNALASVPRW